MFETAQIPRIETIVRRIECLNPAETLPETIFPVTSPRIHVWSPRGVRRTLYSVTLAMETPNVDMFVKNERNMTVVPVKRAAPI